MALFSGHSGIDSLSHISTLRSTEVRAKYLFVRALKCSFEELKGIVTRVTQPDFRGIMGKSSSMTYSIQACREVWRYGSMYGIYGICVSFTAGIQLLTRWEFLISDVMPIFLQISELGTD